METGSKKDPENLIIKELLSELNDEAKLDTQLPDSHPEKVSFMEFDKYVRKEGAIINKVKPRWENANYRYVVAECDIKKGEDIIAIPHT